MINNCPCRILLVEDEPQDVEQIQSILDDTRSAFFEQGFAITCAETLAEAKRIILSPKEFDVILLDLVLPDSRYINSLQEIQKLTLSIPIIVQTALEDEVIAVKALEFGAYGYLPKAASDRNLLLYAIRTAIERKQQLNKLENSQQVQDDKELNILERLLSDVPSFDSSNTDFLSQRMPDIFEEIEERYSQLLDCFIEEKIYKIEETSPEQTNLLIEQLGYLQATPKDIIQIHRKVLKQKQNSPIVQNNKLLMIEGRYLLLKLMGKLAAYYRRYYIGLNKINMAQDLNKISSPD